MSVSVPLQVASPWRATLAGFCASLVGIGLARFAYTPLLPAIVDAHWFAASSAAYLGAANLAGYLAGALVAHGTARAWTSRTAIRGMMLLVSAALAACAWPLSFAWFFAWRLASGLAGGVLMVLAAPAVLPHVPASRRGLASGVIFMGVGAGIAASGTVVPLLLREGLSATWLGLGGISLALAVAAWGGWPADAGHAADASHAGHPPAHAGLLRGLYAEYALNAVGLVPHMIFLVDFVARGLGQGMQVGSAYWVLFGLGALVGPVLTGHLADRVGFGRALRLAYLTQAVMVALPAIGWGGAPALMLSSFVVGAFTPGIVPLALGRIHELLPHRPAEQKRAWSRATVSFAVLQAIAAYAMSFLFSRSGSYLPLFICGSLALLVALAIDLVLARILTLPRSEPLRS
jgi:predicted MFS family arabinose efflux permease